MRAFENAGIDPDFYARREITGDEILPWDHLDLGRSKESLWTDYQAANESARQREAPRVEKAG